MFTATVKVGGTGDRPETQSVAPLSEVTPNSQRTVESAAAPTIAPASRQTLGPQLRNPDRYQIMGEHGRGGLGKVSRAHDRELGRDVAIKELISRSENDEGRFLREALITARLEHPGIVPVHEAGHWPDGTQFYAMKLVSGRSLRDLIAERPTGEARIGLLHHVIAVADAIAYAHGRNIIHRDLKPGNVIVGDFGETIVIDWGLAKDITVTDESVSGEKRETSSSGDPELTAAGSVLGTPAYMAPEQKRGEHVDQRADVFAIGAMLWELCAPRRSLPSNPPQRHRMLRRAGIDKDLIAIINKALDPDPGARYRDAGELAADLKAFKSGARIAARSYSLYAMLAHWTRRHRALALSVLAAIALSATGIVVYVRNIKAERDRADGALLDAQRERDRAKLSEASLLLESDPNRAKDLLGTLALRSPQWALLTSRMRQLSAARVVSISSVVDGLYRAPGAATVEVVTRDGGFHRLEPVNAALELVDHDLTGAMTYRGGQWLYARRTFGANSVRIASPVQSNVFDVDLSSVSGLVALHDAVYALDGAGDVHRLDGATSAVVDHGVRAMVGDGDVLMMCRTSGDLEVTRKDEVVFRDKCRATGSPFTMAVVRDDYAALTADRVLVASRRGKTLKLPTSIHGEYELALSSDGVIAMAEYSPTGTAWFVRPNGDALEAGPAYGSQPYSLAVDGNLAAWGYVDGMLIVRDTVTGTVWPLRGHPGKVSHILVDAANSRITAAGIHDLRVWELKRPVGSLVKDMPCNISQLQPAPDATQVALDCNDGTVRLWSRETGTVTKVHDHVGQAFGVQWVNGAICSGGFIDGHVVCSKPDGSALRTIASGTNRITWLLASPAHDFLVFASSDGKVWRDDGGASPQDLYTQASVYRLAISNDGHLLGSCGLDGSLVVYDLANHRLIGRQHDHNGSAYNIAWVDDELWTSGDDRSIKRWVVRDGTLTLRHTLQAPGSMHLMRALHGAWAGNGGESTLVMGRDGGSIGLHLDMGRPIVAIDISPDQRYVAAGVNGEIVIIDLQRDAIATMTVGTPRPQKLSFLDSTSLAFFEVGALKSVAVDHLDYVPFQATTEP
jgi:serine/threonine protein kinase/WD40 repeat protein